MSNKNNERYATKKGAHGTLYLYEGAYTCRHDRESFGVASWSVWAYDAAHAAEIFYDGDDGFVLVGELRRCRIQEVA